jgi:hypothetical protein
VGKDDTKGDRQIFLDAYQSLEIKEMSMNQIKNEHPDPFTIVTEELNKEIAAAKEQISKAAKGFARLISNKKISIEDVPSEYRKDPIVLTAAQNLSKRQAQTRQRQKNIHFPGV